MANVNVTSCNVPAPVLEQKVVDNLSMDVMDDYSAPATSTPNSSVHVAVASIKLVQPLPVSATREDLVQTPVADLFGKQPSAGGETSDAGMLLLEAFGKARGQGKRKKEESFETNPFDLDLLSPLERAMVCLLEKCMTGFANLQAIVDNLEPADQTEVQSLRQEMIDLRNTNDTLQKTNVTLRQEVRALKEGQEELHLESTTRSMRENLLFHGIPEASLPKGEWENTNRTLRDFMVHELKMGPDEALAYHISTSHRLGRKKSFKEAATTTGEQGQVRGPRPIVARFVVRDDRDYLKSTGNKTLKNQGRGKLFSLSDQFPRTVVTRRKKLIPVLIEKKAEGKTVKLVADKLYINNELFLHKDFPWLKKPTAVEA